MVKEYAVCECGACGLKFNVEIPILLNTNQDIVRCIRCNSELVSIIPRDSGSFAEVPEFLKEKNGVELLNYFEKLIESGAGKEQHERRDTRKEILGRLGILE